MRHRLWIRFCLAIFWSLVWLTEVARSIWRYVPRVRVWPRAKWALTARLLRSTETVCEIDEALHECNLTLQGSCPADITRSRVDGVMVGIGPALITWPRSASRDA